MPAHDMTTASMITCAGCKHSYADSALFCPNCGTPKARNVAATSDPLVGSRALVGNLEFRMPLLRPLGLSGRMYGPVPLEVAVFADAGSGWNRGERSRF